MNNKNNCNVRHSYSLWNLDKDKNMVNRVCNKCGYELELPITEEVIMEIAKQEEAHNLLEGFLLVDNNDVNIINYVELITTDYINYLDNTDFKKFVKRVKELDDIGIIEAKNLVYLNKLATYFEVNNSNEYINNILEFDDNELIYENN